MRRHIVSSVASAAAAAAAAPTSGISSGTVVASVSTTPAHQAVVMVAATVSRSHPDRLHTTNTTSTTYYRSYSRNNNKNGRAEEEEGVAADSGTGDHSSWNEGDEKSKNVNQHSSVDEVSNNDNHGDSGDHATSGGNEEGINSHHYSSKRGGRGGGGGGGNHNRQHSKNNNNNNNNNSPSTAISSDADLANDDAAYHAAVLGILRDMISEMPPSGLRLSEVRRRIRKILSGYSCTLQPERLSGNCTCLFDALELVSDRLMVSIQPAAMKQQQNQKKSADKKIEEAAVAKDDEGEDATNEEVTTTRSQHQEELVGNARLDEYHIFVIPCDWYRIMSSVSRRLPVEGVLEPSLLRFIAGAGAPKFRSPAAHLPHSCSYLVAEDAYSTHQLSQLSTAVFMHWITAHFSAHLNVVDVRGGGGVGQDAGDDSSSASTNNVPTPKTGNFSPSDISTIPAASGSVPNLSLSASHVILPVAKHSAEVHTLLDALRALGCSAPFSTPVTVNIQDIAAIVNHLPYHSNTGAAAPTTTDNKKTTATKGIDGDVAVSEESSAVTNDEKKMGVNNQPQGVDGAARRYLWHELLSHPEVQERFHVEVEMLVKRRTSASSTSTKSGSGFGKRGADRDADANSTKGGVSGSDESSSGKSYVVFVDGTSVDPDAAEAAIYRWASIKRLQQQHAGTSTSSIDYVVNYVRRDTNAAFCSSRSSGGAEDVAASAPVAGGIQYPVYSREGKAVSPHNNNNKSTDTRAAVPVITTPEERRRGKDVLIPDDVLEPHHAIAARLSSIAIEEQLVISMNKLASSSSSSGARNNKNTFTSLSSQSGDAKAMESAIGAAFGDGTGSSTASPSSSNTSPHQQPSSSSSNGGFLRSVLLSAPEQARYGAIIRNSSSTSGSPTSISGGNVDTDGSDMGGSISDDLSSSSTPLLGSEFENTIVVICGTEEARQAIEQGLADVVSGGMLGSAASASASNFRLETVLAEQC